MKTSSDKNAVLGLAWYRADQWGRLRAISEDRDQLESHYEEWLRTASERLEDLLRRGQRVQKVDVNVEDLLIWCRTKKLPVNSSSRALYAAERLRDSEVGKAS